MKAAVIADDLTGACATGGLLLGQGRVRIRISPPWGVGDTDTLIVSTNTRGASPKEATTRTRYAARKLLSMRPSMLAKRIDSTLRGHIGLEVRALLEVVRSSAVVVPAVPGLGRTTVGGMQYVNGVQLADTEAGKDPVTGAGCSSVVDLFKEQTGLPVIHVSLDLVHDGEQAIRRALTQARARLLVVDAETDADIDTIARGCKDLSLLPVDPGPFTAAMLNHRFPPIVGRTVCPQVERVLILAGSPTLLTQVQVGVIEAAFALPRVRLDITRVSDGAYVDAIAQIVCQQLREDTVTSVRPDPPSATTRHPAIARALGVIAAAAVRAVPRVGIITSGGDVATAICHALEVDEIEIIHQIFPLCAVGHLEVRGAYHKIPFVTKGGLVGDEQALVTAVRALLRGGDG